MGVAEAVGRGVAAADDHHVAAGGADHRRGLAGDAAVLAGEVLHGEMDAVEVAAGQLDVAATLRAHGEDHGVVALAAAPSPLMSTPQS